ASQPVAEVGAERRRTVAGDAGDVIAVGDRALDRVAGAEERGYSVYAHHARPAADLGQHVIGEVARIALHRAGVGVRCADPATEALQRALAAARRQVREVEGDPQPLHLAEQLD